jgi:hypothetical protein
MKKCIKKNSLWWLFLGSIPSFFFLRGIHLLITGGGWISTTDQPIHWILLFLEIIVAAFTICGWFFLWYQEPIILKKKSICIRLFSFKTIIIYIFIIFILHIIRVGFWLQNSVLDI